jgi:N,N'-diacetylbacillosaminyl-diphospho-undecaprenol alpha-1,3-N-acetylgalactosaminyltransferase
VKKIAYVSHLDFNLYTFRLAWMQAMLARGWEVCAVVPEGEYGERLRQAGVRVLPYPIERRSLNPLSGLATLRRLHRIFREERFDLAHSFTLKPNIYSSLAGAWSGTPVINHVTGLGFFYTERGIRARLLRAFISGLSWLAFRCARRVVFQNPDDLRELRGLVSQRKTALIPGTGVDTAHFAPRSDDAQTALAVKRQLRLREDAVVVTLIARLLWHKGVREFVEAAARFPEAEFVVVGWIDEGNPSAVPRQFVDSASQRANLHFIGKRDDIREILCATDIFALPSYREGTPRTVLEAMAMGKPVITTDAPGCRQTVADGVNGFLVPPRDSRALAEAIGKLMGDAALRERMGREGRRMAVEIFSNDVVIRQILDLYSQLEKQ